MLQILSAPLILKSYFFRHDSANVDSKNIRIIIVQSGNRLLPEMSEKLAKFALQKLHNSGVEVILNRRVIESLRRE